MKIHEYQARELFEEYGVPVTPGVMAASAEEARQAAVKIGFPVVIKAQVLTGGRGKAGGVKVAKDEQEALAEARAILGLSIKSIPVTKVLVVPAEDIEQEYYLGLTVDRREKKVTLMMSAAGGVDIEDLAVNSPEKIVRLWADPVSGIDRRELQDLLGTVFSRTSLAEQAEDIVMKLYKLFIDKGCSLVEINPLADVGGEKLSALDAKINFDDNAVAAHPELEAYRNREEFSDDELLAQRAGLHFISLEGDIGCVVNGAGLAMATMDMIKLYGSYPANFLDVGGSSSPEKVLTALQVIMGIPGVKGILFNIFGGITRCDDIAEGILMAREQIDISIPIVIRLIGTNDEKGRKMLSDAGIPAVENLDDAVKEIVAGVQESEETV
jgi:succinyl-CoA synthetase beta subunit